MLQRQAGFPPSDVTRRDRPRLQQQRDDRRGAMFVFRLEHADQLAATYGQVALREAMAQVADAVACITSSDGAVVVGEPVQLRIVIWDIAVLGDGARAMLCRRFADQVAGLVARTPVRLGTDNVHLVLSGTWMDKPAHGIMGDSGHGVGFPEIPIVSPATLATFQSDMKVSVEVLSEVRANRIVFAWQPVRHATSGKCVLYYEGLARRLEADQVVSLGGAIDSLERVGLVSVLDHYAVFHVLEQLGNDPLICLGVNISASSARTDSAWQGVMERLSRRRDIARRLIIEITETAPFADMSESGRFVARLQHLGVRVAIDDFGMGHAAFRRLLSLKPDIVKIDAFFVQRAAQSAEAFAMFEHLVALAGTVAPIVIAEGVAGCDDAHLATVAGAAWQQGMYHGVPSIARPWLLARTCGLATSPDLAAPGLTAASRPPAPMGAGL